MLNIEKLRTKKALKPSIPMEERKKIPFYKSTSVND